MKRKYFWSIYFICDLISGSSSWIIFNFYRKAFIENYTFEINEKLILSTILISIFWLILYSALGSYNEVYKKYRIKEITQTISQSFIGIIFIFFTFLLDDKINTYQDYYSLISVLLIVHTTLTFLPRIILTSSTVSKIHNKKIGFNTIIIGSQQKSKDILIEINNLKKGTGHLIIGYISSSNGKNIILF